MMSSSSSIRQSGHRRLPPLRQQSNHANLQLHQPTITINGSKTKIIDGDASKSAGILSSNRNGNGYKNHIHSTRMSPSTFTLDPPGSLDSGFAITAVAAATTPHPMSTSSSSLSMTTSAKMRGRKTSPRMRLQQHRQIQQASSFPRSPGVLGSDLPFSELTPEGVGRYLRQNPEVLDQFVSTHVTTERIEKWLHRKSSRSTPQTGADKVRQEVTTNGEQTQKQTKTFYAWREKLQISKNKVLQELSKDVNQNNSKLLVLVQLAECVESVISSESHTLYALDTDNQELTHISRTPNEEILLGAKERVGLGTSLAATVAYTKQPTRLKELLNDRRHSDGLTISNNKAQSVLALPVVNDQETCIGVVEFYRFGKCSHFTEEEEEVASMLLQWHDMLLEYVQTHNSMQRQRTLSDFLLEVTRSIFQDIVSMDVVIIKIMNFAKALVHADRTALFLLDTRSNELYARIFDDGYSMEEYISRASLGSTSSQGDGRDTGTGSQQGQMESRKAPNTSAEKKHSWQPEDIRFSMNKGVAGYVASTGKVLNIRDAYKDKHFNPEVDIRTGYKTKTILCMPIFIRGVVIGVVQMVNKLQGTFTKADEEAFEMFAVYCGLALHHAKLYEKIRRSEQKYKVALDVLSYHSQATQDEVDSLKSRNIPAIIPKITRFDFSPWSVEGDDKCVHVLYMFRILFEGIKYDMDDLIRFTLTVRKNYRNVPYHNWTHAFSVAHGMFAVLQASKHELTPQESVSLFVACLCHDLDHRGKTNAFMVQSASPLAAIYTTSTMEHHHFNQTVTILQNEGHNIFKYLSSDEYKKVLGDIKGNILATDLAVFFKNKVQLTDILEQKSFSWDIIHHRSTLTAVMMTACDLCAMSKPWGIQKKLVYIIMEEFWQQGDEEKRRGLMPMGMMDRDKMDELPSLEVGFIESICVPCYHLLSEVMPDTLPMLKGALANLDKWKVLANEQTIKGGTAVDDEIIMD